MKWLVFSYSLPTRLSTASRVRIWRRLKKSGAVSPKAGVHVLPNNAECQEAVRWLVSEIEQEQGEVLVMEVNNFQNIPDDQVMELFRKERAADYGEIEAFLADLEQQAQVEKAGNGQHSGNPVAALKRDINKLKKNIDAFSRVDFFQFYDKKSMLDRLYRLQKTLVTSNLIVLIMFCMGTLNTFVLRKMKEERYEITRNKENIKVKRALASDLVGC